MNGEHSINLVQIILLLFVALLLLIALVGTIKGWVSRAAGVVWVAVCLAGVAAIIWPGLMTRTARFLGIGRGTDLLLYGSVVAMVVGFLMMYARIRRLRREITLLVRHLAIRDAVRSPQLSPEGSSPSRDAT